MPNFERLTLQFTGAPGLPNVAENSILDKLVHVPLHELHRLFIDRKLANLAILSIRVRFFCLNYWRMLTAIRRCPLLWDIKGLGVELLQKAYLASWLGHFGTETIHSLTDRFPLSNRIWYSQSHESHAMSKWLT